MKTISLAEVKKPPLFWVPRPYLSAGQWALVVGVEVVALAFLLLSPWRLPAVLVFAIAPTLALAFAAGDTLRAVLRRPTLKEFFVGMGLGFLALGVSLLAALLLGNMAAATQNPVTQQLAGGSFAQVLYTLFLAVIQLFGEEILTLIAFWGVLAVSQQFLQSETASVVVAWLVSSLLFGLVHLQTYGFNLLHVVVVIALARVVLTFGFIYTKNLATSYISHLVDDNAIFLVVLLAGALA